VRCAAIVIAGLGLGCGDAAGPGVADAAPGPRDAVDAAALVAPPAGAIWLLDDTGLFESTFANADISYGGTTLELRDALMTEVAAAGDCRLLEGRPTTCDPACPANYYCAPDGGCRYGYKLDPGTVTITGAGAAPVDLVAERSWTAILAEGDLVPGAPIEATSTGATVPPFALAGTVPPALDPSVVPTDGVVVLDDMTGATLAWAAVAGARYRLWLGTPHGHGGYSAQVVVCEGADTGTVTIAPALVAALPALAVPNCVGLTCVPGVLRRSVATSTPVADGTVSLVLGSRVMFWPSH
jgi:hypothetical protein